MQMFYFLTLILLSVSFESYSQSMTIHDGTGIVVHDGGKIIFSNATPNNILKLGTQGGILTNGENSQIIFKNVNQVGEYAIPFASTQGNTIPFKFTINTNGTNPGDIHFTTWETDNQNLPYPTIVQHITDMSGGDNSLKVIDRFWKIDLINFGNKPKGEYEFTYDDTDLSGNFINESGLVAQRWNSDNLLWGDWLYSPTANTLTNKVNILIQNPEDEYSVWTLVDQADPLPIELIRFITNCRTGDIEWVTWTETNSSHFELQYSEDAITWNTYEIIQSSGNSNSPMNYRISNPNFKYYRLKMVDIDGTFKYSNVIINDCIEIIFDVVIYPNPFRDNINIRSGQLLNIQIYDVNSKIIYDGLLKNNISIDLSDISSGVYFLRISDNKKNETHKIIKI
jgi:hypothetical protein